ncbi:MAG: hypothetical protein JWR84_71 [Caulobacter sp.]|nr:hypothetical protein [Caulobacter sp.]
MRVFLIGALALTAFAGAANAETQRTDGWLTLKAKTTRGNVILDGAVWSCKGDVCRAPKVKALPADQQCKQLREKLGEVTGFGYRGANFEAGQLAACNAA